MKDQWSLKRLARYFQRPRILFILVWALALGELSCERGSLSSRLSGAIENLKLPSLDDPTIFGGIKITAAAPSTGVAGIRFLDANLDVQTCSGALLNSDTVLTAAHCVPSDATEFVVFFGTHLENLHSGVTRSVQQIIVHPKFEARHLQIQADAAWNESNEFDLALLKLSAAAPANERLFKLPDQLPSIGIQRLMHVAGFGIMSYNRLVGQGQGAKELRETMLARLANFQTGVLEFSQGNGTGICVGDSGGPAFSESNQSRVLYGIASEVRNPGQADVCAGTSRFIDVLSQRPWIDEALQTTITL